MTNSYRDVANQLLVAFVRVEGTNIAQLLRKSMETRDWLKSLDPRSARSAVVRVFDDLKTVDNQVILGFFKKIKI